MINLDTSFEKYHVMKIINQDLDKAAQNYSTSSIDLYRPIKDNWFIHLNYDNKQNTILFIVFCLL